MIQLPEMLLAIYKYIRTAVNNKATNKIHGEDECVENSAIQTPPDGGELHICTINATRNLVTRKEFDSKFREIASKVDNLTIQIQHIVRKQE